MVLGIGRTLAASLLIGIASCAAALAQEASASVESKTAAYRDVRTACERDTAKFCPAIAQATAIPRDQVMCLKTYRVDLSLNCRKALAKVKAATETEQ